MKAASSGGGGDDGLSSGTSIAIGVTISFVGVCFVVVGIFYWRIRVARKRAAMVLKPVDQPIELLDRTVSGGAAPAPNATPAPNTTSAANATSAAAGTTAVGTTAVAGGTTAVAAVPRADGTTNQDMAANGNTTAGNVGAAGTGTQAAVVGTYPPVYLGNHSQTHPIHGDPPPYSP